MTHVRLKPGDLIATEPDRSAPISRPTVRQILLSGLGLLIIQIAWIFAVPAFGGSDEFDHAYRAASVARGDWVPDPSEATRGTGAWLQVPDDIVDAARAECQVLPYTTDNDCVGTEQGGSVRIASGAGRYHPVFYAVIGLPALPFDGEAALYAMRIANAVLCNAFFVLGLLVLRRWTTTGWPIFGALVGCTPIVVYSASIAAPNGVEIVAALGFWAAVLGLLRTRTIDEPPDPVLLLAATVTGSVLVTVRSLGPLWCALIVLTALACATQPFSRCRRLLRSRSFVVALGILGAAGTASLAWIRATGSLVVGVGEPENLSFATKVAESVEYLPLWLFQTVAAFPYRNQVSPAVVYATVLVLGVALSVAGWRAADRRMRWTLALCLGLSAVVPFLITLQTYDTHPGAWQGRYGMPYSIGLPILAGLALARRRTGPALRFTLVAVALSAIATAASLVAVVDLEIRRSPSYEAGVWSAPPAAFMVLAAVVGTALMWLPALGGGRGPSSAHRPRLTDETASPVDSH